MIDGTRIEEGWVNISKEFNEKYKNLPDFGVDSNLETSIML